MAPANTDPAAQTVILRQPIFTPIPKPRRPVQWDHVNLLPLYLTPSLPAPILMGQIVT